jgi:hypothetical protein
MFPNCFEGFGYSEGKFVLFGLLIWLENLERIWQNPKSHHGFPKL